jgi:hypothetical protein
MLAHLGRTLHVGLLADCFFDPDTALCLDREGATPDRSAPTLSIAGRIAVPIPV